LLLATSVALSASRRAVATRKRASMIRPGERRSRCRGSYAVFRTISSLPLAFSIAAAPLESLPFPRNFAPASASAHAYDFRCGYFAKH
ncbi:MAG: hypothetical protein AAGN64_04595, partial [Bacteroidota bacterium]